MADEQDKKEINKEEEEKKQVEELTDEDLDTVAGGVKRSKPGDTPLM